MVMSAFASPRQDGLGCHFDAQDVISIQISGTKRFHYAPVREVVAPYGTQYIPGGKPYDELFAQVPHGFPDREGVRFETAEMRPGAVLYLPRGTWHYTEAAEPSLAISLTISPPTLLDCALAQIRWLLLQDSAWREPLVGAVGNGAQAARLQAHAQKLLERLPQLVAALTPDDLTRAPIPVSARLAAIDDRTRFQRIPDARLEVETRPSPQGLPVAVIRQGHSPSTDAISARLEVPPEVLAAFRWIDAQKRPFTAAALRQAFPQAPAAELTTILVTLTRAQFIKLLWFPELPSAARVGAIDRADGPQG